MTTTADLAIGQIRYTDKRQIQLFNGHHWIPVSRYFNESMIVEDLIDMANALDNIGEPRTKILRDALLSAYDQARLLFEA